jgi:hypothetical protein
MLDNVLSSGPIGAAKRVQAEAHSPQRHAGAKGVQSTNKFRVTKVSISAPQCPNIVIPAKAGTHGLISPRATRFGFARRHEDPEQPLCAFVPLCEPFCRQFRPWIDLTVTTFPAFAGMTHYGVHAEARRPQRCIPRNVMLEPKACRAQLGSASIVPHRETRNGP